MMVKIIMNLSRCDLGCMIHYSGRDWAYNLLILLLQNCSSVDKRLKYHVVYCCVFICIVFVMTASFTAWMSSSLGY